jgi:hypothetical protein
MLQSASETAFKDLFERFAQSGVVRWIGIRPKTRQQMKVLENTFANVGGLTGDRTFKPNATGKRQVTLIRLVHL